jgi:hypothetical protein
MEEYHPSSTSRSSGYPKHRSDVDDRVYVEDNQSYRRYNSGHPGNDRVVLLSHSDVGTFARKGKGVPQYDTVRLDGRRSEFSARALHTSSPDHEWVGNEEHNMRRGYMREAYYSDFRDRHGTYEDARSTYPVTESTGLSKSSGRIQESHAIGKNLYYDSLLNHLIKVTQHIHHGMCLLRCSMPASELCIFHGW